MYFLPYYLCFNKHIKITYFILLEPFIVYKASLHAFLGLISLYHYEVPDESTWQPYTQVLHYPRNFDTQFIWISSSKFVCFDGIPSFLCNRLIYMIFTPKYCVSFFHHPLLFYVEIYIDVFLAVHMQFIYQKLQLKKFMLFQREVGGVEWKRKANSHLIVNENVEHIVSTLTFFNILY